MKEYIYQVNGLEVCCQYEEDAIQEIFLPLVHRLTVMQHEAGRRLIVFLAAPPAVGKTTLATFLSYLSREHEDMEEIQAVSLDGFHYHQAYILSHHAVVDGQEIPMKDVKGCPETYDIEKLIAKLSCLREADVAWPGYSRKLHDVVEDEVICSENIILIEGNWLLLKEAKWCTLQAYCDYSVFIYAEEEMLKARLINRKMQGGSSYEEALAFYNRSDRANVRRVLAHSSQPDLFLCMDGTGNYRVKEIENEE